MRLETVTDLKALAYAHPGSGAGSARCRVALAVDGTDQSLATLVAGAVYWLKVGRKADGTNEAVQLELGAAPDDDSFIVESNDGIVALRPTAALALHIKRVGADDFKVYLTRVS